MEPILMDFPTEFTTERLFIRMPLQGDGKKVYEALMASMSELKPWMPFAQREQKEEEVELNIRQSQIEFLQRKDLRLLVYLKETDDFVASAGLHRIAWDVRKFEIGYWIDSRYSRKGYMTEAVEGITKYAVKELGARRLEIRCDPLNKKSRAIPERLGFILEGILKQNAVSADREKGLRDTCIYAKTF
ncbi:GNAT family N-acetyltransferase [Bacillus massilinigeriensis]|uniref:GNAT family N-acetyltransferase n=1 Tax=Bacillus mediterraneensis TaxID=1805474 RepID=UPI0008F8A798|nr:GNAT family N-acetyltransferase [Bacillus mediterraneensis]